MIGLDPSAGEYGSVGAASLPIAASSSGVVSGVVRTGTNSALSVSWAVAQGLGIATFVTSLSLD